VLLTGNFRGGPQQYVGEPRVFWEDGHANSYPSGNVIRMYLYPLGKGFRLVPSDSIEFHIDTAQFDMIRNFYAFFATDLDGDSASDLLVKSFDNNRYSLYHNGGLVLGFRCGKNPSREPAYTFHSPFNSGMGNSVIDVGDACGRGYHSLLITDENSDIGAYGGGAVFLYNIGKGYVDSCVAYAAGIYDMGGLGHTAIAAGDLSGDGLSDWIVGSKEAPPSTNNEDNGKMAVFLGDPSYATPPSGVQELGQPTSTVPTLTCYPNPCRSAVFLRYDLAEVHDTRIEVCDILGRIVLGSNAPHGPALWRISVQSLSAGTYECRLISGTHTISRMILKQ
jgi:hypothetical protein